MKLLRMRPQLQRLAMVALVVISASFLTSFLAGGFLGRQEHLRTSSSSLSYYEGSVEGSDLPGLHRELLEYQNRERRRKLYHSFDLWSLNYDYMLTDLKVFIYPGEVAGNHSFQVASGNSNSKFNTEDFFFKSLSDSDFVTNDPEKAVLYVLPISVDALRRDADVGPEKLGRHLRKHIQVVRTEYPFWDRSLGADHVLIACHDLVEDLTRNYLELKKNAIWMDCFPFEQGGHRLFYPHKDITMPPQTAAPPGPTISPLVKEGIQGRSTLVYYGGGMDRGDALLAKVDKVWSKDPDFMMHEVAPDLETYRDNLLSSKFCLVLNRLDQMNLVEMFQSGCVPVIVADGPLYDLPFQDIANWQTFCVLARPQQVKQLKLTLEQITEDKYVEMQRSGAEFALHLRWHDPPQPRDAFFMLSYQLWVRRHSIRYVQRSLKDSNL